jgi:pyrroline-5-carboxylate reductase
MTLNKRIGFMGAGQMAEALARGLIDKGVVSASQICCSDPAGTRKQLFRDLGATPYDTNLEVGPAAAAARHPTAAIVPLHGWPK